MLMKQKIKILIADDHKIVRIGLSALLAHEKDMSVVGEAEDGQQVLDNVARMKPDVVIMDLMMPVMDGEMATTELRKTHPDVKVIILTSYGTADGIANALQAGATGAVLKTADDSILLSAIRAVASGQRFISEGISQLLANDPPAQKLSPRQLEVLHSLTRGLTNKEIALQLGIGEARVEEHVNAIFSKINASNRAEAVAIAMRKHLLKI